MRIGAFSVYMILEFSSSLFMSLIFTANIVYHVTVVGLNPLQLVLVGTILETTVFIFEVPTGVLADVKSRRLSVVIGYALMGLGFIVEGSFPFFPAVAFAQVLWGFGYTFTSGATQAWMVDEIGEERAGQAFLRGSQAARAGGLLAIPFSVLLGRGNVALPIVLGGVLLILLAAFLATSMSEEGFAPTPAGDRTTWALILRTAEDARQLLRRQPILLVLLGTGLFYGLYSEGFDRLWTAHLLRDFTAPFVGVVEPIVWFGAISAVGSVLSLVATGITRRHIDVKRAEPIARTLLFSAGLIVIALAGFGLARAFWLALLCYWLIGILRTISGPLHSAWLNLRIDDPQVRATMFSVSGQVDAIGQIAGGPAVGAIGNLSIRAALATSALMLSPVLPLYALVIRQGREN